MFKISVKSDPPINIGGAIPGSSRTRLMDHLHHAYPFQDSLAVSILNLTNKDVKCAFSIKLFNEDGSIKETKKEKTPSVRPPKTWYYATGIGKFTKMLTASGTLLLQVGIEICNGLIYESSAKKIRLDDRRCKFVGHMACIRSSPL